MALPGCTDESDPRPSLTRPLPQCRSSSSHLQTCKRRASRLRPAAHDRPVGSLLKKMCNEAGLHCTMILDKVGDPKARRLMPTHDPMITQNRLSPQQQT
eukprot:747955-Hanusia_phi.AAC.1